jgi:periplasmic protein TonB
MIENRFFRSLCTLTASAVLVGGSLILLTSTAPWTPRPQVEIELSTPDSAPLVAQPSIEYPRTAMDADQVRTNVPDETEADPAITASTDDVSAAEEPATTQPSATEPETTQASAAEPETTQVSDAPTTDAGGAAAMVGTPLDTEADDASPDDVAPESMAVAEAASEPEAAPAEEAAPEPVSVPQAAPEPSHVEQKAEDASDQIGDLLVGLPPRAIASNASGAATEQVAELLAATPPAPAPVEDVARPEPVAAVPPPPLPKRKPANEPVTAQEAVAALPAPQEKPAKPEAPKPAQRQELARQEPTPPQNKGPWRRPMGLAPADKPVPTQVPTARPSGAAYSSSVWSALARHKPRAGQRGSTTVVFAIGPSGALRGLKVGRSSGNARIDQLALATVRSAAPFPPPPSGGASYTIRIDLH